MPQRRVDGLSRSRCERCEFVIHVEATLPCATPNPGDLRSEPGTKSVYTAMRGVCPLRFAPVAKAQFARAGARMPPKDDRRRRWWVRCCCCWRPDCGKSASGANAPAEEAKVALCCERKEHPAHRQKSAVRFTVRRRGLPHKREGASLLRRSRGLCMQCREQENAAAECRACNVEHVWHSKSRNTFGI